MTDALSYEVAVTSNIIEIPAEYVELSGIRHGNSFEIKISKKRIRLDDADIDGIMFDEDQYELRESDGEYVLRFLTKTNLWDKKHIIPTIYLEMVGLEENDKFFVRIGRNKISLLNANYFNKEGDAIGDEN